MSDDIPPRDDRLFTLASWIDEGREVDWEEAAEAARDDDERAIVEELRLLAGVARVCRDPDSAISQEQRELLGETPPAQWGGLTLLEAIGRGAFATVYRARDNLQREVALKLFAGARDAGVPGSGSAGSGAPGSGVAGSGVAGSGPRGGGSGGAAVPERVARTRREGEMLARVKHPNIVTIHGADEYDGRPGLWMEFIHGRTLEAELATRGTFGAQEAAVLGRELCRALAAVHGAGLLHRDVKAHNVMRETGGRIVLMDFGAGTDVSTRARRAVRDLAGTPLYLAPEVFAGAAATPASDIYSLGVLLFHLATGKYPVDGANRSEIEAAHTQHRRMRLRDARPDLPDAFVQVLERAIAPAAEQRFQTAGELDDALSRACGLPTHLPTPSSSTGSAPADAERSGAGAHGWDAAARGPATDRGNAPRTLVHTAASQSPWWRRHPGWSLAAIAAIAVGAFAWPMVGRDGARVEAPAQQTAGQASAASAAGADRSAPGSAATASGVPTSTVAAPEIHTGAGAANGAAFSVKASLYRQVGDRKVDLADGDPVGPGDDLGLHLWSTQPLYTYVVNRDDHGEAYLLFPLKGHEKANPLPAGQLHELPGAREGSDRLWEVTSRGGREHFLIFADTSPVPEFDDLLRSLPAPEVGKPVRYAALPRALVGRVRGVGGVASAPGGQARRVNALFATAQPLRREAETVTGPWLRQITFKNPLE